MVCFLNNLRGHAISGHRPPSRRAMAGVTIVSWGMVRKSVKRFSEKVMPKQRAKAR
jgi:hypothetical protein